jgi:hypothetical protein
VKRLPSRTAVPPSASLSSPLPPDPEDRSAGSESQAATNSPPSKDPSLVSPRRDDADASMPTVTAGSADHPSSDEELASRRDHESLGETRGDTLERQRMCDHPLDQQSLGLAVPVHDTGEVTPAAASASHGPDRQITPAAQYATPDNDSGAEEAAAGVRNPQAGRSLQEPVQSQERAEHREWMPRVEPGTGPATASASRPLPAATVKGVEVGGMNNRRAEMVLESAFSGNLLQLDGWDSDVPLRLPEDPAELLSGVAGKATGPGGAAGKKSAEATLRQAAVALQEPPPTAAEL